MSAHNRRVISSPRAEADHEDIIVFGDQRWGDEQAIAYSYLIDAALGRLGMFPEIGRRRVPVEQHVVYYRIAGDIVLVAPILHKRTNPQGLVTGDE